MKDYSSFWSLCLGCSSKSSQMWDRSIHSSVLNELFFEAEFVLTLVFTTFRRISAWRNWDRTVCMLPADTNSHFPTEDNNLNAGLFLQSSCPWLLIQVFFFFYHKIVSFKCIIILQLSSKPACEAVEKVSSISTQLLLQDKHLGVCCSYN